MLFDKLSFPGANDLTNTDLLHPLEGLSSRHIDEIDGCDQEYQNCDSYKNINIGNIAVRPNLSFQFGERKITVSGFLILPDGAPVLGNSLKNIHR